MRTPAEMQIITIDITNACDQRCSNCTRFCGNHPKPFFMDFDTFKRAIDSLEGYEGLASVIGGEPTLHPEFGRFLEYMREKYGTCKDKARLINTKKNYIREVLRREVEDYRFYDRDEDSLPFRRTGPCIFTNAGSTYRKYYEDLQDTFHVQFLNDHISPSFHQPGLFARKDLGIPDDEWIKIRDNCWLQNNWSATITPKGAFFCEIAGGLDMLFNGPGGWKIEPGWWKRTPEDFGDQLHWCELCGFAFDTFVRNSDEEIDDVSPTLYQKLEALGSPRLKAGKTNLVKIENGKIAEESKANAKRFTAAQVYVEHYEDRYTGGSFDIKEYDTASISNGPEFGVELNKALTGAKEWLLLCQENPAAAEEAVRKLVADYILNPGVLHLGEGFAFLSKNARSLRAFGFDRVAHITSLDELVGAWQPDKVLRVGEIGDILDWKRDSIQPGKRYAIWGMGVAGSFLADAVESSGGILAFAIDKDPAKWGEQFYGMTAYGPEYLKEHSVDYDFLMVGHYTRYTEVRREALALGVRPERIIMPYEV